jgi:hypothetical protein
MQAQRFSECKLFVVTHPISLILGYGESNIRCSFISLLLLYFVGLIYCDNSNRVYTVSPYATEQFVNTRGRQGLKRDFVWPVTNKETRCFFYF